MTSAKYLKHSAKYLKHKLLKFLQGFHAILVEWGTKHT